MSDYQRSTAALLRENDELKTELRLQKEFAWSVEGNGRMSLFMTPEKCMLEKNQELEQKISYMLVERKQELEEVQALRSRLHDMASCTCISANSF